VSENYSNEEGVAEGSAAAGRGVQPITVMLADDSEVMRRAIRQLLTSDPGIDLVGEAANFTDLAAMVCSLKPKVVVVDIHMPGKNNLGPSWVKAQLAGCAVLAISLWNDDETRAVATSFGATRLLGKGDLDSDLIPAILQFS
jgi:DNA-binding NarL/FixJ family response regulator